MLKVENEFYTWEEIVEKYPDQNLVFDSEKYINESKTEYYFEYDSGEHCIEGIAFYRITFSRPIKRRDFLSMMEIAKKAEASYLVLYDKDFQLKYNIKKFEKLPIDYQDMM